MIRLIILLIFLLIYFIISTPIMLFELILQKFNMNARNISSLRWVQFGLRIVLLISGAKVEVHGEENIPENESVLFVSNHRSYFDIIATYPLMKRPTGYIAKKEMKKIPFLSWIMYFVNCLFLDRENPREGLKTILQGAQFIKDGISIFVCPEGTRSKTDEMLPFKEGSMKMATKAKAPVVPVGIIGSAAIFEEHVPKLKPGKIVVCFGKPIYTKDLSRDEQKSLAHTAQKEVSKLIEYGKQF